MSYRRVARTYRRNVVRTYGGVIERRRARLAAMAAVMVAGLVAGMAILAPSHSWRALGISGNAANLVSSCATGAGSPPGATAAKVTASSPAMSATAAPSQTAAPAMSETAPAMTETAPAMNASAPAMTASAPAMNASAPATSATAAPGPTAAPAMSASAPAVAVTPTATASATPCPSPTAASPATAGNDSCDIIVPANPLSARGLATPYQLTGPDGASASASGCTEANAANLGAFVQATILDRATGALSVYEPLVITSGTTPAAAPVVPALPAHAVVTIDIGFNGTNLTQVGATPAALRQGRCVNGLNGSIFGQVSFCNGPAFFRAAARAEAAGRLVVPSVGTSPATGQPCPTTRSFDVVDQDPSDNVTTTYLLTGSGQTAQFSAANAAALPDATHIANGSDNKLLTSFIDPTLGCAPFGAPDLSQNGAMGTSQALNELSAAADQAAPVALIPENDEMALAGNAFSVRKTNLYRSSVGQPAMSAANNAADSPAEFCQNMVNVQTPFLSANQAVLAADASPVPAVGSNLLTFMANRLSMSFANLGCGNYGLADPVTVTLDATGAATAATFSTTQQAATGTPVPPPHRRHRASDGRNKIMNPAGM
jgi:hypothetical protein